jgi:hypothetical protein
MSLDIPERQLLAYYEKNDVPWQHRVPLVKIHGSTYTLAAADAGDAGPLRTGATACHERDGLLRVQDQCRRWDSYPAPLGVTAPRIEMRWDSYPRAGCHSSPYCRADLLQNSVAVSTGPEIVLLSATYDPERVVTMPLKYFELLGPATILSLMFWPIANTLTSMTGTQDDAVALGQNLCRRNGRHPVAQAVKTRSPEIGKLLPLMEFFCGPGRLSRSAGIKSIDVSIGVGDPPTAPREGWAQLGCQKTLSDIIVGGNKGAPSHQRWGRAWGILPHVDFAIEHGVPFTLLTPMIRFDPLNESNLASAELAAGRILMNQGAVKPGPTSSDLGPLDVLLANKIDSTGDVLTSVLSTYTSVILKNDAAGLMQQRSKNKKGEEGGT